MRSEKKTDLVETPAVLAVFAPLNLHVKAARESRKEEGRLCIPAAASMEMSSELPGFNNVPHSMLKVTLSLQEWVSCTCNRGAERRETHAQTQTSWDLDPQSTNTPYPLQWVTPWRSQPTHHRFNHRFKCGTTQKYVDKPTRFHKEWPRGWDRTQNRSILGNCLNIISFQSFSNWWFYCR